MSILSVYVTNRGITKIIKKDIEQLDILNIGFGVLEDGYISLKHLTNIEYIKEIRKINNKLKIYLSLANGETSKFGDVTRTEQGIKRIVDSIIQIIKEWDFDGIDVDWEYPDGPEERKNHTRLLKALREGLDANPNGKYRGLSVAAGSKSWYFGITELSRSVAYLDYVNLMTYDINAGTEVTMHHTCPTKMATDLIEEGSVEENIEVFLKNGVPKEKLIIGAAFYSRQWRGVENKNNGLHSHAGTPSDYGPGYTQLVNQYINKNGYTRYWDEVAHAPYLFNGNNFITYDDEESLRYKCELVKKWNIAGIMAWEYTYDEEHVLLTIMREALD